MYKNNQKLTLVHDGNQLNNKSMPRGINQKRLPQIDGLRGIAALWVVLYHWTTRYHELFIHTDSFWLRLPDGRHGVHLFFMISGFVILMTLDKVHSIADFAFFRFVRLYPTLWICALLTFLTVFIFGLPGREVGLKSALMNVTMIPYFLGFKFIDPVYWSLEVEFFFYLVMGLIVGSGLRRYLVAILTTLVIVNIGLLCLPGPVTDLPRLVKALRLLLSMRYLNLFLFGVVCYEMTRAKRSWQFPVLGVCLLTPLLEHGILHFVIVSSLGFIFWLATQREVAILRIRVLLFLGFVSYPLYMLHQNIGFVIIRQGYAYGLAPSVSLFITATIVMLLAVAVSYTIEHPANQSLRNWYLKRRAV